MVKVGHAGIANSEAFAATQEGGEIDDEEDDNEGGYRLSLGGDAESSEDPSICAE